MKMMVIICFIMFMVVQMVVATVYVADHTDVGFAHPLRKFIATIMVVFPMLAERYILVGKYAHLYLPSAREVGAISFSALARSKDVLASVAGGTIRAGKSLKPQNFRQILSDLSENSSFRYINEGTLTEAYFQKARLTLDDPYVYLVISNTGSAAAEVLSVFTQKDFNHASISFDEDLETIVSYNGGGRVYPPGLNRELIEHMLEKPDSSIFVYRLKCTRAQKAQIIDLIEEINRTGSAYDTLGIVIKHNNKPNILYCSKFVYNMLDKVGLAYFDAGSGVIKPTDFIEKDYYRVAEFVAELI
jgi:hypothetical protein